MLRGCSSGEMLGGCPAESFPNGLSCLCFFLLDKHMLPQGVVLGGAEGVVKVYGWLHGPESLRSSRVVGIKAEDHPRGSECLRGN